MCEYSNAKEREMGRGGRVQREEREGGENGMRRMVGRE